MQHAYQVGGSLQADTNYITGFATPLDRDRMLAMQHVMDDFESSTLLRQGRAHRRRHDPPADEGPLRGALMLSTTNTTSSPTNAAAYKPSDLVRDTLQKCFNGGGNPTVLLVSTDFLSGFAVWGHAAMRINAGTNVFGTPIDVFEAPFLSGISIIPCPPASARHGDLPVRPARCGSGSSGPMIDKPRGSRGDAFEGDIIMEGAIELDNEAHHACGLRRDRVRGSLMLTDVGKPRVVLGMPSYGAVHYGAAMAHASAWSANPRAVEVVCRPRAGGSFSARHFNEVWAIALDLRDAGEAEYFAMIHADIEPESWWIDTLLAELRIRNADLISVALSAKKHDDRGRTSTAIGREDDPWGPKRGLTLDELTKLPPTFGPEKVCGPGEVLLVNTGPLAHGHAGAVLEDARRRRLQLRQLLSDTEATGRTEIRGRADRGLHHVLPPPCRRRTLPGDHEGRGRPLGSRRMAESMNYTFPGVWPFVERIAASTGRDLHQAGRCRQLWHVSQVQDALGQLPRLDRISQEQLLAHVRATRESLALALEGVDAAIAEVTLELGLVPEADKRPIRKREK